MPPTYDALLLVSFGGPDGPQDVIPFLENVLRGRNVPRERMLEVAEHYYQLGGKSPINEQNQALLGAIVRELNEHGPALPVYWGNRNWHPLLPDTVRQMREDGIARALALCTSAYSSYSSCRQYLENIAAARTEVGEGAPVIEKIRPFFNHPGFIEAVASRVLDAMEESPLSVEKLPVLFTAHSIPAVMAETCGYEAQLQEACRLTAERTGLLNWQLVYQSRSGPPQQPWLEPDVCDAIEAIPTSEEISHLLIVPIGFLSDHMEVLFDLDVEARVAAEKRGLKLIRAATVGTHPRMISMIRELILERTAESSERPTLGTLGPCPDYCATECCAYAPRRPAP